MKSTAYVNGCKLYRALWVPRQSRTSLFNIQTEKTPTPVWDLNLWLLMIYWLLVSSYDPDTKQQFLCLSLKGCLKKTACTNSILSKTERHSFLVTFTNVSHESGCAPGSKTFGKFAFFAASGFTVSQRCCNKVIKAWNNNGCRSYFVGFKASYLPWVCLKLAS